MSAPFRYARILNGLSPLISRRSAISPRTRATDRLSNPQAFRFEAVLEQAGAAARERFSDTVARVGRSVAEKAPAAPRAADFRCRGAGLPGAGDQVVDGRRRDPGREPLPVVPLSGDLAADFIPVAGLERSSHGNGCVADALEAVENVLI